MELRLERSARTRDGFARLVSKHLVALGHPFRTRLLAPPSDGSSSSASSSSKTASASGSRSGFSSTGGRAGDRTSNSSIASSTSVAPSIVSSAELQLQPASPSARFDGAGADEEQQVASRVSVMSISSNATSIGIGAHSGTDADKQSSKTPKRLKSFMSRFKRVAQGPAKLLSRSNLFGSTLSLPSARKLSVSIVSITSGKSLDFNSEVSHSCVQYCTSTVS